jgi:hypothetical protein
MAEENEEFAEFEEELEPGEGQGEDGMEFVFGVW